MDGQSFDSLRELPVYSRRADIMASVDAHQVTIITAETGAGKSTQVPQFLAEHGYSKIIVTQPRILAARNLSSRVRQEYSWRQGKDCTNLVGYRTAHERDDSPENIIVYCTDGLQLVRELTGSGIHNRGGQTGGQILILDEIHEWNENMEVLIAWAKKRCLEDPLFRVILMSATIEAASLATYFSAPPPITVAGRGYPVDKQQGKDLIAEVLTRLGGPASNMLVFLPGKAEIEHTADAIATKANDVGIPVIPLHGQLEPSQQQLAFRSYPQGKVILTTNVAQTSITIDDIDIVIDSGLERRAEVRNGVEGLFIAQIPQADCLQRAGRAGRTKPGVYILAQYDTMPCQALERRQPYGIPEILRKHIDRLVLRLANISIDIEDLDFFHSPSHRTIKLAKHTLVSLGALTPSGEVTAIGSKMERFPVESGYARMLVESEHHSTTVQAKLAAIIAIQEVGGIVKGGPRWTGWRAYTRQSRSDLLAQYDVFLALPGIYEADYEELGIIAKNVAKAQEVIERLDHDLGLGEIPLSAVGDEEIDQLLQCIVAGQLHQLWTIDPKGEAINLIDSSVRNLSSGTVVKHSGLVAGIPFDLEVPTGNGLETLHLVNDITAVNPAWLEALAPDQFQTQLGKTYYDSRSGTLANRIILRYGGKQYEMAGQPLLERTDTNRQLFTHLYGAWLHGQLEVERKRLQGTNYRRIPSIPLKQVQSHVKHIADGAVSLLELDKKQRNDLAKLSRLDSYLDEGFMAKLNIEPKRSHDRSGQSHHHRFRGSRNGKPQKRLYDRRRDY